MTILEFTGFIYVFLKVFMLSCGIYPTLRKNLTNTTFYFDSKRYPFGEYK